LRILQVITPSRFSGAERVCVEIEVDTPPDRKQAITATMAKISGVIEEQIRKRPDQRLWFHDRWRESR
jgi:lauroyl/myristoyl acyltransferase